MEEALKKWQKLFRDYSDGVSEDEAICEGLSNEQLGLLWLARKDYFKTYLELVTRMY